MNGGIVFLLILIILVLGGYAAWVIWSRTQAQKLGLPAPSLNPFSKSSSSATASNYPGPAPVGIKGWIDAQIFKFKNRNNRYATGAYEEPSGGAAGYGGAARGGRGAENRFDPDEAWDARVGNEGYYEEQELGLQEPARGGGLGPGAHPSANPFESTPYGAPSPGFGAEPDRGRSRTRGYDEQAEHQSLQNPFGDDHAASLRGVSPRPLDQAVDTSYGGASSAGGAGAAHAPAQQHPHKKDGNSPTESRRSLFKEDI